MSQKAVVLLSGGLDSATVLAIALKQNFEVHALSFFYGQRHRWELQMARAQAAYYHLSHVTVHLDLDQFGGSALTDRKINLPVNRTVEEMTASIPVTYVPARNTVFLAYALSYAEVIGARDIFIGVNALDYAGYPDCRPEYIAKFEELANLATKASVSGNNKPMQIHTPLIHNTKAEIISAGLRLGVDYAKTSSCYQPTDSGIPCGKCDSCLLRIEGFRANGYEDPLIAGAARA